MPWIFFLITFFSELKLGINKGVRRNRHKQIWSLVWINFLSNLFASSYNRGNFYQNWRNIFHPNCNRLHPSNLYDPASGIRKNIYRWIFLHFAGWCDTREPAPGLRCCSPVWSVLNKVAHINFNLYFHVLSMGKRIMDRQSTALWEFTSRHGGNNPLNSNRKPLTFFVSIEDKIINYLDEYLMVIRDKNKLKPPNWSWYQWWTRLSK